jgi:hypothetical protein
MMRAHFARDNSASHGTGEPDASRTDTMIFLESIDSPSHAQKKPPAYEPALGNADKREEPAGRAEDMVSIRRDVEQHPMLRHQFVKPGNRCANNN